MSEPNLLFSSFVTDWFSASIDVAVKAFALLAIASTATPALRRASSALRHFVWLLAISGVLLLPVLSVALPQWGLLPAWLDVRAAITTVSDSQRSGSAGQSSARLQVAASHAPEIEASEIRAEARAGAMAAPLPGEQHRRSEGTPHVDDVASRHDMQVGRANVFEVLTLAVWLVGVGVCCASTLIGAISLCGLGRSSQRVSDESQLGLLTDLCRQLGVRRPVTLLQSHHRSMPMTWGAVRPRLLVPSEFADWENDRKQTVLLHELAHIKRRDYLVQLVTGLACAIHWFNPLVWLARRQMVSEREGACDDLALRMGIRSSDYAGHLLHIGSRLSSGWAARHVAAAMARQSEMESRLRAVLDPARNRKPLTRATLVLCTVALGLVAATLAMLRTSEAGDPLLPESTRADATQDPVPAQSVARSDAHGDPLPQGAVSRLGTTRWRHKTHVALARFSPNGKVLATAGGDTTIRLWDVFTGKQLHELTEAGRWPTYGIVFSPGGGRMASVHEGGIVRLWDVATGWQVCEPQEHPGERSDRYEVAFAPDGRTLATVGVADVRLWSADALKPLEQLATDGDQGRGGPGVAFSPDGRLLAASGGADIRIWKIGADQPAESIKSAHTNGTAALVFTPDSKTLISGGNGQHRMVRIGRRGGGSMAEIKFWDVATEEQVAELTTESFDSGLYSLALSRDGAVLVSGHHSEARVWDVKIRTLLNIIAEDYSIQGGFPCTADISPDGKTLASRTNGNTVGLWDVGTGRLSTEASASHQRSVTSVVTASHGEILATVARYGSVHVWQTATGKHLDRFPLDGLSSIAASPSDKMIAVGGGYRLSREKLELHGSLQVRSLDPHVVAADVKFSDVIGALAYSKDGRTIAATTNNTPSGQLDEADEAILIIDAKTGNTLTRLSGQKGNIGSVAFAADGKTLFAVHTDATLRQWDIESGKMVRASKIAGHERDYISHGTFSADREIFVTCEVFGKSLVITDVASAKHVRTITAPNTLGNLLAISPDGQVLASACQPIMRTDTKFDERIHVWDLATGRELLALDAATDGTVASLAFLPDGRTLVSGMDRGTALLWGISEIQKR